MSAYHVIRYERGNTYYLAKKDDWVQGGEIPIWHLLSGDKFTGKVAALKRVDASEVPRAFLLDAQAYNPVMCASLPEDFQIELEVQRFGLQAILAELRKEIAERDTIMPIDILKEIVDRYADQLK